MNQHSSLATLSPQQYRPRFEHTTFGHRCEEDLIDLLNAGGIPCREASLYEDERMGVDIWVKCNVDGECFDLPVDLTVANPKSISAVDHKLSRRQRAAGAVIPIFIPKTLVDRQDVDHIKSEFLVQVAHRVRGIKRSALAQPVPHLAAA